MVGGPRGIGDFLPLAPSLAFHGGPRVIALIALSAGGTPVVGRVGKGKQPAQAGFFVLFDVVLLHAEPCNDDLRTHVWPSLVIAAHCMGITRRELSGAPEYIRESSQEFPRE